MSEVNVNFEIRFGLRKVNKIRDFASTMEQIYRKVKAEKGDFRIAYFKRPWRSSLNIEVSGERETVREFLRELRVYVATFGVKASPENWWDI